MSTSPAEPPVGGTVALIASILPSLGPGERRVAEECVRAPQEVALLSVGDLAARTSTSSATVVRACQTLGFRGFQHLRLLLLRDVGAAQATGPEPAVAEGPGGRIAALFAQAADELRDAPGSLDVAAFEQAAEAIARASRVLVVGNGGSAPAAQMAALRLLTTGRPCEAPVDAVTQQLSARLLSPADVCLAVSDSGMNGVTLQAVDGAVASGATVVGVTGYARSRLGRAARHTLVVGASYGTWDTGAVTGNLAQILLLSALQTAVSGRVDASAAAGRVTREAVLGLVADEVEDDT
ncbi:MurR/RpiR family transcriptional regulator [Cellulomonas sp. Marseille-Q8402]